MKNLNIILGMTLMGACNTEKYVSMDGMYESDISSMPQENIEGTDEDGVYTNPWVDVEQESTSTFSADVDTGSYTLARRSLMEGSLPQVGTVRTEEFINYFSYDDVGEDSALPFSVDLEAAPSAFGDAEDIQLLRIGIQADAIPLEERDPANLVFLLDVSGSMSSPDKLGLVQYAMNQLVDTLSPDDTIGIVVYAGAEGIVLPPTAVSEKSVILDALDQLSAGGSTNGEAGIRAAYQMAEEAFRSDGINRVILCSDGDMNVGLTGNHLVELIEDFRDKDIFLTTLGVGMGNYQDDLMEQLADHGNGNYAYIDSPNEALRVLGENLVSTLQVVAKDVKIQVHFDPKSVERWRLIGYENRVLDNDDFENDDVDAGDIGAGHSVTALYELDLTEHPSGGNLARVLMRYKEPTAQESTEHDWILTADDRNESFAQSSPSLRMAAAVAEFGEILRGSEHSIGMRFTDVFDIAQAAIHQGEVSAIEEELLELISIAQELSQ